MFTLIELEKLLTEFIKIKMAKVFFFFSLP